ncbi:hypothetical protein PV327_004906 [Microctonus hyperodae]|uniref:Uncharacterized protein n=1 Tax=Microctonus hyperodae TaxID=165561 RepID=A0AA39FDE8_MICHY|nr:hypothetical protein PV327_004906 [Microctonus hyperodae]
MVNHMIDIVCTVMSVMDGSIDDEPDYEDYSPPAGARNRGRFSDITNCFLPRESVIPQTTAGFSSPISMAKTNFGRLTRESMGSR